MEFRTDATVSRMNFIWETYMFIGDRLMTGLLKSSLPQTIGWKSCRSVIAPLEHFWSAWDKRSGNHSWWGQNEALMIIDNLVRALYLLMTRHIKAKGKKCKLQDGSWKASSIYTMGSRTGEIQTGSLWFLFLLNRSSKLPTHLVKNLRYGEPLC